MILQASAEDLPAIAALCARADAALGLVGPPVAVTPPPDGARVEAEMRDLLHLCYAPPSVDDAMIERMMITHHAVEWMADMDVLGIRPSATFEDADRIIHDHMAVGKVLTADRSTQLSVMGTGLLPYASGRIYVSKDETEMIAIYDEPPAAPGRVVGLWRVLRLPQGSVDPTGLRATLVEEYGDSRAVEDIQLAFGSQGVAWIWHDPVDFRCGDIHTQKQSDRWRDERGATGWIPALMSERALPALAYESAFDGVTADPLSIANLCPSVLGVRLASYDGRVEQQLEGDEIVT